MKGGISEVLDDSLAIAPNLLCTFSFLVLAIYCIFMLISCWKDKIYIICIEDWVFVLHATIN